MVEYGNGVGQVAGQAGGSSGSQPVDVGAQVGQFMTDSMHTISTTPPAMLVAAVVVIVVGLIFLRRAF
jgi:hypothetical protein